MSRRIRILNAIGDPRLTKVLDAETGEDLTARLMVQRITIEVDIRNRGITAVLHCADAAIDVIAEAEIVV
jgi:hypothetical protein